jgi:hypothetical protein
MASPTNPLPHSASQPDPLHNTSSNPTYGVSGQESQQKGFTGHISPPPASPVEPSPPLVRSSTSPTLEQYHHPIGPEEVKRRQSFATARTSPPPILPPIQSPKQEITTPAVAEARESINTVSSANNTWARTGELTIEATKERLEALTLSLKDLQLRSVTLNKEIRELMKDRDGSTEPVGSVELDSRLEAWDQQRRAMEMDARKIDEEREDLIRRLKQLGFDMDEFLTDEKTRENVSIGKSGDSTLRPHLDPTDEPSLLSSVAQDTNPDATATTKKVTDLKVGNSRASSVEMSTPARSTPVPSTISKTAGTKRKAPASGKKIDKKGIAKPSTAKKRKLDDDGGTSSVRRTGSPASSRASKTPAPKAATKQTHSVASSPPAEDEDDQAEDEEDYDENQVFCICRKPDDHSWMIACDGGCEDWFHGKCVDIPEEQAEVIDRYICKCSTFPFNYPGQSSFPFQVSSISTPTFLLSHRRPKTDFNQVPIAR